MPGVLLTILFCFHSDLRMAPEALSWFTSY